MSSFGAIQPLRTARSHATIADDFDDARRVTVAEERQAQRVQIDHIRPAQQRTRRLRVAQQPQRQRPAQDARHRIGIVQIGVGLVG